MRKKLALAVAGVAAAAAFAPLSSASAVCMFDLSWIGGPSCYNPCNTVVGAYDRADEATRDRLPDAFMECLA